jgi:hypothetical protein
VVWVFLLAIFCLGWFASVARFLKILIMNDGFLVMLLGKLVHRNWVSALFTKLVPCEGLKNQRVRHELVVSVQGDVCDDAGPEASYYMDLEKHNHHVCALLKALWYTVADMLRKSLQIVLTEEVGRRQVTLEAIQNQLKTASTAGDIFRAAPGMHITNNDNFIADERKKKEEKIEQMTKDNILGDEEMEREEGAKKVLERGLVGNTLTKP